MAEFVVTELLSFAINIAFAFTMFLFYIFDTLGAAATLLLLGAEVTFSFHPNRWQRHSFNLARPETGKSS